MNANKATFIGVIAVALIAFPLNAQEHPSEHPSEHPAAKQASQSTEVSTIPITKDNLAEAIAAYVEEQSGEDMKFNVKDEETGKELKLELVKVHRDRLASVGDDTYFACADFKADDGETYDLDVFMKGKSAEKLVFDKFMVHKENNMERYTWVKEDGTWKQKPVKEVPPEE
jgi:hypothetical protein